jgi:hypothetical protein
LPTPDADANEPGRSELFDHGAQPVVAAVAAASLDPHQADVEVDLVVDDQRVLDARRWWNVHEALHGEAATGSCTPWV